MNKTGTVVAIIAVLVAFGILILSFIIGVDFNNNLPKQANGTLTGYPVWHPPIEGDEQKNDSVVIFGAIILLIAGFLSFKWIKFDEFDARTNKKLLTYFADVDGRTGRTGNKPTNTIEFNRLLGCYIIITALAGILYYIIDVGKIWSTFGILHNANEVTILVILHQGGKITSNSFIAWLTFYVLFATTLSIFLEWPFDALWFKVQGLCSDYALVVQFTRMYFNTHKGYKDETLQRLLPSTSGESDESEPESDKTNNYSNFKDRHILLLVLGASTHVLGNILTTIWIYEFYSYVIFSFSYCISYPAYAYFVYLDTHSVAIPPSQKLIILPDTSKLKVILVTLFSIFLSFLTVRIGLFVQS